MPPLPPIPSIPGGGTATTINTFVGAFWKTGERGERLISMTLPSDATYTGKYAVQVAEMNGFSAGDIIFAEGLGPNTANLGDPDANGFYVDGDPYVYADAVAGGKIEFRIGLSPSTTSWIPSAAKPARYAKVVVLFGSTFQYSRVLWLRQGEDADYLMRPTDPEVQGGAVPAGRATFAKKFSPYNLTAEGMSDAVDYVDLTGTEGTWTDYPSQIGAKFQYGNSNPGYERRAYHPTKILAEWNSANFNAFKWTAVHETCPDGYRHPAVSGSIPNQSFEFGLSLWAKLENMQCGNVVDGYYADGFTDRRFDGNAAILGSGYETATRGSLFYNPLAIGVSESACASIFLPFGGQRAGSNGNTNIVSIGNQAFYWSMDPSMTMGSKYLIIINGGLRSYQEAIDYVGYSGRSVRCVKE
jgi:hypothetical protein